MWEGLVVRRDFIACPCASAEKDSRAVNIVNDMHNAEMQRQGRFYNFNEITDTHT